MSEPMMEELAQIGGQVAATWSTALSFANRYGLESEMASVFAQFGKLYSAVQDFSARGVPDYDTDRDEPLIMNWDGDE